MKVFTVNKDAVNFLITKENFIKKKETHLAMVE